jgi:glutathione S-transferase
MIKVVSFKICPFVQRVTAALEARNIPFEIEYISLKDKPEWFLDISPNGQVPVLVTENKTPLFESDAIVEYINDEYGELNDISNEDKALERAWSYLGTKNYLKQCSFMRSKDTDTFKEREANLLKEFNKIENKLEENNKFFSGDSISEVDIAWFPLLYRLNVIKNRTFYDLLKELPKIERWSNNLLTEFKNTVSEDFEEVFSNFYINDNFLSRYCHSKECCDIECKCENCDCKMNNCCKQKECC